MFYHNTRTDCTEFNLTVHHVQRQWRILSSVLGLTASDALTHVNYKTTSCLTTNKLFLHGYF